MKRKMICCFIMMTSFFVTKSYGSEHFDIYADSKVTGINIDVPLSQWKIYNSSEDFLFGFNLHSDKIYPQIPVIIKGGNLTPGGLYSKLKNPLLSSSITPFSSTPSEVSFLTANLPSTVSSSKPISFLLQTGYHNQKKILQNLNFALWNSPTENLTAFSSELKIQLIKKYILSLSTCAGYFNYQAKESKSWFLEKPYYHEGVHFCCFSQAAIKLPKFTSIFSLGLFETPFSSYEKIYCTENKLSANHFTFTLSCLYLPGEILTIDNSTFSQLIQIKQGIHYNSMKASKYPVFFKTGYTSYYKYSIPAKSTDIKIVPGFQIIFPITTINASSNINFSLTRNSANSFDFLFDSVSVKLANSWSLTKINPSISAQYTFNPSTDYTSISTSQSYSLDIFFPENPQISIKNKIGISKKDYEIVKKTFSCGLSTKYTKKALSITGKFNIEMEF